jgi:hypothetical protein
MPDELELSENAWARGWRDAKRGVADWRFWLIEVVGGGIVGMYYDHAFPVIVFVLGMALCLWIGTTAAAPIRQRDEARLFIRELQSSPALSIVFPREANLPNKISLFRSVTTFLPRGVSLKPPPPPQYEFYIQIVNNTVKTIHNVGIKVVSANIHERPLDLNLLTKNANSPGVDIAPKSYELFRLGSVMRREETKIFAQHKVVDQATMASMEELARAHEKYVIGLIVPHSQGMEPLLRNDGQILRVVISGDDVDPSGAEIVLNMKGEINVEVRPIELLDVDGAAFDRS